MSDLAAAAKTRFWSKTAAGPNCCIVWTGTLVQGYGQFGVGGKNRAAHRIAYELLVGPIPDGLTLDHLCRNRACVNPEHLEPVDNRTNVLRGEGLAALNAAKTHCPRGHAYEGDNVAPVPGGGRRCRACNRIKLKARDKRRRDALALASLREQGTL